MGAVHLATYLNSDVKLNCESAFSGVATENFPGVAFVKSDIK